MDSLRTYLNSMPRGRQREYAKKSGTTLNYLRKYLSMDPRPKLDAAVARRLDENSGGKVPKWEIRPDVWPELVPKESK